MSIAKITLIVCVLEVMVKAAWDRLIDGEGSFATYLLQALPEPHHRWVRHWLIWMARENEAKFLALHSLEDGASYEIQAHASAQTLRYPEGWGESRGGKLYRTYFLEAVSIRQRKRKEEASPRSSCELSRAPPADHMA